VDPRHGCGLWCDGTRVQGRQWHLTKRVPSMDSYIDENRVVIVGTDKTGPVSSVH
jgi:hypothetical protein